MLKRILLPLDGSELGEATLPTVRALIEGTDARVVLLRVLKEPVAVYPMEPALVGLLGESLEKDHLLAAAETRHSAAVNQRVQAEGYLQRVASAHFLPGARVQVEVLTGSVSETISQVAQVMHADMIAMSTHWHGDANYSPFGAVAEQVVRSSPVAVLLVPSVPRRGSH